MSVQSFEPVVGTNPRILILGSMPGVASLKAVQYYAHPRNLFWVIMEDLFDIDHKQPYVERIALIKMHPVVLWDSLSQCERPGSLDSNINRQTAEPNNIGKLLIENPSITVITFNGAASKNYFDKLVKPQLNIERPIEYLAMPSTSPANASIKLDAKLAAWRRLRDFI
ncbi:MAG: TDG/mug DNA glycosylase family protein [Gammaproteobacteria bacterium]